MTKLTVPSHNFVNVPNSQETFQSNSSVHSITERFKHHLHRPIANILYFQKSVSLCWHKICNSLLLSLINYIHTYAYESLGYVVEKKSLPLYKQFFQHYSCLFIGMWMRLSTRMHKNMTFIIINLIQHNIKSLYKPKYFYKQTTTLTHNEISSELNKTYITMTPDHNPQNLCKH